LTDNNKQFAGMNIKKHFTGGIVVNSIKTGDSAENKEKLRIDTGIRYVKKEYIRH